MTEKKKYKHLLKCKSIQFNAPRLIQEPLRKLQTLKPSLT